MTSISTHPEQLFTKEEKKEKLPGGINILTILTFIGCAIGAIYIAFMPTLNKFFLEAMDKEINGGDLSADKLAEMEHGRSMIELTQDNIVPIMAIGFVSIVLCFIGALWMRKLKKDGYWLYLGGELLPVIVNFVFLGTAQFNGVGSIVFILGVPLLFIALYTMQRKFLTKK